MSFKNENQIVISKGEAEPPRTGGRQREDQQRAATNPEPEEEEGDELSPSEIERIEQRIFEEYTEDTPNQSRQEDPQEIERRPRGAVQITDEGKSSQTSQARKKLKGSVSQMVGEGFQKVEFENGVYEGSIVNGKRHGNGTYTWDDGNQYSGSWSEDQKAGEGVFQWVTGDRYEGEYLNDLRNGKGIKYYANGDQYRVLVLYHRATGRTA